ncbi:MAG: endonuclease [candidate division SR1 bacterium CG_4_9_14_3_um_filter_40_9]|nr:MAG: endonuclease [candidate division SR1 bacterium CG_4_9_14_3_um_filter_40_9]
MKSGYVYILTNRKDGVLYIGVTNNLCRRTQEHKAGNPFGFSTMYNTKKLVYYEKYEDIREAIQREKQLKKWKRNRKIVLIEKENPERKDISEEWNE